MKQKREIVVEFHTQAVGRANLNSSVYNAFYTLKFLFCWAKSSTCQKNIKKIVVNNKLFDSLHLRNFLLS